MIQKLLLFFLICLMSFVGFTAGRGFSVYSSTMDELAINMDNSEQEEENEANQNELKEWTNKVQSMSNQFALQHCNQKAAVAIHDYCRKLHKGFWRLDFEPPEHI